MHRLRLALVLALCSPILLGCPNDPKPPPPDVARAVDKGDAKPSQAKVHGDPHAGLDMSGPAAMPVPAVEPGPPRDVTPTGVTRTEVIEGLALQVPEEWKLESPANTSMRKAEFVLPGPGGDVRVVVYRFAGGAGGFTANLERWTGQMAAPAGVVPIIEQREVGALKLATIDIAGRYAGSSMPGAPPQAAIDDARLLAVAIEQPGVDPWYLKLVGAKSTVDVWAPAWANLLGSLALAQPPAP